MSRASVLLAALWVACGGGGVPGPAPLDTRHESCRHCRMAVSDVHFAAQLVAPGEEPLFFDDVGCLAAYLAEGKAAGEGWVAYVADHRSGQWVLASKAIYTRAPSLATPMGSHLIAHADAAARQADPAAAGLPALEPREVFPPAGPPGGKP